MKSIKSCNIKSRRCWVRKMSFANVHKTARCLVGVRKVNWGRINHSTGIHSGTVLSIHVSLCRVQSQIRFPSPYSVRRYSTVSILTVTARIYWYHSYLMEPFMLGPCRELLCTMPPCSSLTQWFPFHFSILPSILCGTSLVMCISWVPDSA